MRSRLLALFLLAALVGLLGPAASPLAAEDWVVRQSAQSVEETVERLQAAIERSGSMVIAVFDHGKAAREIGYELGATTVVVFAKPKSSSPLIAENRRSGIDMPQKILVWEEDGVTYAGFPSPAGLAVRYGFDPANAELESMRSAMDALLAAAVGRGERRANGAR